ncbi:hypothetical protein EV681_0016 [Advenella incenata]|uniref:Uncharacterized protein n=1 Tax=Advenella incenata TaxID=267800 RepID=A0A4Q7VPB0_9BURK|nr:hypothetical protein [Advenella incenata]RZT98240.1 hypothetical protein EV681_0016 [Advenella incenata]
MVSRRNLKNLHEEAVLRQFKDYLEKDGINLKILERPEPPEAIVELNGRKTWIEITDAFLDSHHAISLTSGASDDVEHVPDHRRLIYEPDESFSAVFHSVIEAKYDKASMHSIANSQGSGILLVGVFTPFTNAVAVAQHEAEAVANLASKKSIQVFETIYTYDGTGQRSFHVVFRRKNQRA